MIYHLCKRIIAPKDFLTGKCWSQYFTYMYLSIGFMNWCKTPCITLTCTCISWGHAVSSSLYCCLAPLTNFLRAYRNRIHLLKLKIFYRLKKPTIFLCHLICMLVFKYTRKLILLMQHFVEFCYLINGLFYNIKGNTQPCLICWLWWIFSELSCLRSWKFGISCLWQVLFLCQFQICCIWNKK